MKIGDPETYAKAKALAATVDGGDPMAWKEYEDGSMLIVLQSGQILTFQPDGKQEPDNTLAEADTPTSGTDQPAKKQKKRTEQFVEDVEEEIKKFAQPWQTDDDKEFPLHKSKPRSEPPGQEQT